MVGFKEQLIGYIRDEMHQGFSLRQIHDALVEQGYDSEEVKFATAYIKTRFRVSEKDASKTRKGMTDEHHLNIRFYGPVVGIILLTFALMSTFFTIQGAAEMHERQILDLLPYYKLGLDPDNSKITETKVLLSRASFIDVPRADAMLRSKKGNQFFDSIQVSEDIIDNFHKTATAYTIQKGDSISHKTLVEIRAKPKAAAKNLKIIDVIPKYILPDADSVSIEGGSIVENDPILQWSFSDVHQGQLIIIRYIIDDKLDDYGTLTIPVTQKELRIRGPTQCGNALCEIGESYLDCCTDCGCLPGFDCRGNSCRSRPKDECEADVQCDDGDFSTADICSGTPKKCSFEPITLCANGDDYCPADCTYDEDLDCEPPEIFQELPEESDKPEEDIDIVTADAPQPNVRGRYVINKSLPPWDPAFRCHEDWWCTDGKSCTYDFCDNQTFKCYWEDVTECIHDDQCCPPGCNSQNDDDCA